MSLISNSLSPLSEKLNRSNVILARCPEQSKRAI
jgi:hypothetical protein